MTRKREPSRPLRMRRIALVICEGETEACYLHLLRTWYKTPLRIVSHVAGSAITPSLVDRLLRELRISARETVRTFLMYDMDVPAVTDKLRRCNASLLLSNPCFELWLLLHVRDQKSPIASEALLRDLRRSAPVWQHYAKSSFTETQKTYLRDHTSLAVSRARQLPRFSNPSTDIYQFIELLSDDSRLLQDTPSPE